MNPQQSVDLQTVKDARRAGPMIEDSARRAFGWFLLGASLATVAIGTIEYFDARRDAALIDDLTDAYHECRDMREDSAPTEGR